MVSKFFVLVFSLISISANADQISTPQASDTRIGKYLGTVLHNGTNTECTLFANPVMAVGPAYGIVNVGGSLVYAWHYNCYEMRSPRTARPLYYGNRLVTCPQPQPEPIYCPAWVDPIYELCSEVGGKTVACPGSCTVLCTAPTR